MDPLNLPVRPLKWRRKRTPLSEEVHSTYRSLIITLMILGLGSTGTYLYMNSLRPAKGYELKQLQADYEELQSKRRKLDHKVVEAQSFLHIENHEFLEEMNAVQNGELSYVEDENYAQNTTD